MPSDYHSDDDEHDAEPEPSVQGLLRQRDVVAHRLDRRDPGGTPCREPRGGDRHDQPHGVRGHDGAGREHQRLTGQVQPEAAEQRPDAEREQHPEAEADGRADQADHGRLEQHRPRHLAGGGAERPEQGQLAAALGDQDRERVDDQERPDHQGDPGEDQQEGLDEPDRLLQLRGGLVRGLVAGHRLVPVGKYVGHPVAQVFLRDAVLRGHPDVGERVVAVEEQLLGRAGVEDRERRAVERPALPEVGDADQCRLEPRGAAGGQDGDPVAHVVAGLLGGAGVQCHLVAAVRLGALDDAEPLQPVPGGRGGPVGTEGGRAERADHLALGADDVDAERRDVAVDPRRPGYVGEPVAHASRDRERGRGDGLRVALARAHHHVAHGRGEQRGEAAVQGVGEDQGAADERDAEHDRERAHQQPQLAAEQALERRPDH